MVDGVVALPGGAVAGWVALTNSLLLHGNLVRVHAMSDFQGHGRSCLSLSIAFSLGRTMHKQTAVVSE